MQKHLINKILLGFAINFVIVANALAINLYVSPTELVLTKQAPIAILEITNHGDTLSMLQLSAAKSSTQQGVVPIIKTGDLTIFPPIVNIAPHAKQIVQIGLKNKFLLTQKSTYQLYLQEIPIPATVPPNIPGQQQKDNLHLLNPVLKINIPVTVNP